MPPATCKITIIIRIFIRYSVNIILHQGISVSNHLKKWRSFMLWYFSWCLLLIWLVSIKLKLAYNFSKILNFCANKNLSDTFRFFPNCCSFLTLFNFVRNKQNLIWIFFGEIYNVRVVRIVFKKIPYWYMMFLNFIASKYIDSKWKMKFIRRSLNDSEVESWISDSRMLWDSKPKNFGS